MTELELMNRIKELSAVDGRFLGYAQLKSEGEVVIFDDAPPQLLHVVQSAIAHIYRKQKRRKKLKKQDFDRASAVVQAIREDFRTKAEAWCARKDSEKAGKSLKAG